MTDTFSKFGYSFQVKLIAALFKDRLFLQQICDILKPEFMESESNQWIIKIIIEVSMSRLPYNFYTIIIAVFCFNRHKSKTIISRWLR